MMIYTEEELNDGAAAITSCLNCCDAVIKYSVDRSNTVILWMKNFLMILIIN